MVLAQKSLCHREVVHFWSTIRLCVCCSRLMWRLLEHVFQSCRFYHCGKDFCWTVYTESFIAILSAYYTWRREVLVWIEGDEVSRDTMVYPIFPYAVQHVFSRRSLIVCWCCKCLVLLVTFPSCLHSSLDPSHHQSIFWIFFVLFLTHKQRVFTATTHWIWHIVLFVL